ncbi:conserved hypothetical protein [Talaromyces stipitatus ATCC 10500]|uniref:NAD(P)-binding domain-containing protein n=1 Tax=Talaromyces stipitatus (strain ATCC 10500 / CBS 375.48 / QM 6759 / NRRL 1006) TaxID=441959 RepID=B8MA14_TALSN|nr:uncharacterized protein TSTA_120870 [Talaromyces stipitatus ATCC 10500]EED18343.1 conserved hypothetical protein [Talaromyces stipitatus ATCC 10500]
MKVGIAGITGKFARQLLTHLLEAEDDSLSIKGYCRDPSKLPGTMKASTYDVVVCCYLGDDKLMVDGQKLLIDACESASELSPKDPMIHVKAYLDAKKSVAGVHILIGGFMEPIFSPFFNIVDVQTNTFRYWGDDNEIMEGTTYNDAAKYTAKVALDAGQRVF